MKQSSVEFIAQVVQAVVSSRRYDQIQHGLVERIAISEANKIKKLKDATKATKNKLHQVAGAYLQGDLPYMEWLAALKVARQSKDPQALRQICRNILRAHSSTKERLEYLDRYYTDIFSCLPPVNKILDVACGLNPIAIPWMNLPAEVEYLALDIYQDLMGFLQEFFSLLPIKGQAHPVDVLGLQNFPQVDLVFILKTIPCLEQIEKTAGQWLIDRLNADHLVVSFPTYSLGGRKKNMPENYEAHFYDLIKGKDWQIHKLTFPTEIVFVIRK